jgi:putative transposase
MDIELMFAQPGKPSQNSYIEKFNRTARNEWLNMHIFDSIEHAFILHCGVQKMAELKQLI